VKIFGFAGWSGSGKTTLTEKLIPRFASHGLSVSLIKHAHHEFDIDQPGKVSYRHRKAGCIEVMVASDLRWALMHEMRGNVEESFEALLMRLAPVDLLLVEGWKRLPMPKLEVYCESNGKPPLYPDSGDTIGIVSDTQMDTTLPCFGINEHDKIAQFVLESVGLR
jgi:molybdopterin-guanine dinucleotide biosynthesis protein B